MMCTVVRYQRAESEPTLAALCSESANEVIDEWILLGSKDVASTVRNSTALKYGKDEGFPSLIEDRDKGSFYSAIQVLFLH